MSSSTSNTHGDDGSGPAAIRVTGHEQKQAWLDNVFPPVEKVGDGLWSIPVPIPDNPLRYVLVYALDVGDGVAIVDAGWPTDDAWKVLVAGLDSIGSSVDDVRAVLVTHIHADHYGLAGRVRERSGAWIGLHPMDAELLSSRYEDVDDILANMRSLLVESGVPERDLNELAEASMRVRETLSVAEPDVDLVDDFRPELPGWNLRTIWTPGHSPGHVCFFEEDRQLLLSGDHVLPRITPNVSAHPQQRKEPLGDFLQSLRKVRDLPVEEVLPAHEYRFAGLTARVDEMVGHHHDRLREMLQLIEVDPGCTSWELTQNLTWSRPWDQIPHFMRRAANGETLAHLHLLERRGLLEREGSTPARWSRVHREA